MLNAAAENISIILLYTMYVIPRGKRASYNVRCEIHIVHDVNNEMIQSTE